MLEPAREEAVAASRVVHERRSVAHRREEIDRRRPRLVVDAHPRRGVLGQIAIGGDHGGDGLTDMAHGRPGQQRLLGLDIAGQRGPRNDTVAGDEGILAGDDRDDAGRRRRGRGVDAAQVGVSMEAAHESDVQEPRQLDVARVAAVARQQPPVLAAADGGAEGRRGGGIHGGAY